MRRAWAIVATAVAAVLLTAGVVTPADATAPRGNAYVVVGASPCAQSGGEVRNILIANSTAYWSSTSWDYGDNVVYPQVRLGIRNNLQIQASCYKRDSWFSPWYPVGYGTVVASITPTSNNQSFKVG